ncbi:MAG TPA: cobalt ECF transporter T component CbiQ [Syntrophothermus lipocalidus]|nr:cobalt ECF transporter T component CbiQ [Syntrophothermus lipocalidus]
MAIPEWMVSPAEVATTSKKGGSFTKTNFIRKTMNQLRKAVVEELATEKHARGTGLWQGLDPRAKLVCVVLSILSAGMSSSIWELVTIGLGTAVVMALSRLPVWTLQKKIWGFIPLVTIVISLPAALNLFTKGTPLLVLAHPGWSGTFWGMTLPAEIYLTQEGMLAVARLGLRVGVSLSLAALLVLTTPVGEIFKALRAFRLPTLLVTVLEMSYRYLVVFLQFSLEMWEARFLRTVGRIPLGRQQRLVASSMGALFAKSMAFADEVHLAMRSRGYSGELVLPYNHFLKARDWEWCLASAGTLLAVLLI